MNVIAQKYISGGSAVKIGASIESAIMQGVFSPGSVLPTVRALAGSLGVSPATVAAAYRLLRGRGLVAGGGRRGTVVTAAPPVSIPRTISLIKGQRDLSSGNPDPEILPSLAAALRSLPVQPRLYGEDLNLQPLVHLVSDMFRGEGLPPGPVAVTGGALDAIERVLREHVRAGDRVIVEDPCFTGILDLVTSMSLIPVPLAVDDEGITAGGLRSALRTGAAAIIVTPRAQNPTGAAFSSRRVRELKAVLRSGPDILLIEDDHAGPISGAPLRSLSGATSQWAFVRSVSKSLGPDLRVAFVTGDSSTIGRVEGRQVLGIRWVSHMLQQIVMTLLSSRGMEGKLEKAAAVYAQRRDALLTALDGFGIPARGRSGLNIWIPVSEESRVVSLLGQAGWAVAGGERYRLQTPPAIRVTIATLAPRDALKFARQLSEILRPSVRTAGA